MVKINKLTCVFIDFIPPEQLNSLKEKITSTFKLKIQNIVWSNSSTTSTIRISSQLIYHEEPIIKDLPSKTSAIWIKLIEPSQFPDFGIAIYFAELENSILEKVINIKEDTTAEEFRASWLRDVRTWLEKEFSFPKVNQKARHNYKGICLTWAFYEGLSPLKNRQELDTDWLQNNEHLIHRIGGSFFGWLTFVNRSYLVLIGRDIEQTHVAGFPFYNFIVLSQNLQENSKSDIGGKEKKPFAPIDIFAHGFLIDLMELLLARYILYFDYDKISNFLEKLQEKLNILKSFKKFPIVKSEERKDLSIVYDSQMQMRKEVMSFRLELRNHLAKINSVLDNWAYKIEKGASVSWEEASKPDFTPPPYELTVPYPLWWIKTSHTRLYNWGPESPLISGIMRSIKSCIENNIREMESVDLEIQKYIAYTEALMESSTNIVMLKLSNRVRVLTLGIFFLTLVLVILTFLLYFPEDLRINFLHKVKTFIDELVNSFLSILKKS